MQNHQESTLLSDEKPQNDQSQSDPGTAPKLG